MRRPDAPAHATSAGEVAGEVAGAEGFVADALRAADRAAREAPSTTERIAIAGRVAQVRFAGPAMRERIFPSLAHLAHAAVDAVGEPSLAVTVFDSRSTGVRMPRPAWAHDAVAPRGEVEGLFDDDRRVAFNVGSGLLLAHDRASGRAVAWTRDAAAVPFWETASPLRSLLAWWLGDHGLQVVHAAGVGDAGRGVLLTGRGGSGKTTTALLCVQAGFAYAGDNNLVLEVSGPRLRAHALYASATVRPGTLERMPALRERLRNADRLDAEKGLLFVGPGARDGGRLLASFDVAAVLLPRVTGERDTRLVPASAGACMAALAPSSILSLPGARAEAFARLAAAARAVPAFDLALGGDVAQVPGVVASVFGGDASARAQDR